MVLAVAVKGNVIDVVLITISIILIKKYCCCVTNNNIVCILQKEVDNYNTRKVPILWMKTRVLLTYVCLHNCGLY